MGLREALICLVKWKLAGYDARVVAAYLYFVENYSLTEISRELGVPRNSVAGYLGRLKLANGDWVKQSSAGLGKLVLAVYHTLSEVEPVYTVEDGLYICGLCGKKLRSGVLGHLDRAHRSVVRKAARYVVRRARQPTAVGRVE